MMMDRSVRRSGKAIPSRYLPIQGDRVVMAEARSFIEGDELEAVGEERWGKRVLSSRDGGIIFEVLDCSPYNPSLSGRKYEVRSRFGPIGTCPLCNNADHAELDAYFARNMEKITSGSGKNLLKGFPKRTILEHMALHVGPIYVKTIAEMDPKKVYRRGQKVPEGGSIAAAVSRAVKNEKSDDMEDDPIEVMSEADIAWYDGAVERNAGVVSASMPIPGRPEGALPGDEWYAFDGEVQVGALRPWAEDRVKNEVVKRTEESITFYSEMMGAREKASRIYDEVMDSDIEAANEGRGGKGKPYIERNYSAAIAAVREMRTIATDMAKLALIATKYSDGKEKTRVLSPVIQGMIDDLGVFEKPANVFSDADDLGDTENLDDVFQADDLGVDEPGEPEDEL